MILHTLPDFFWYAGLAGSLVALVAGPLGAMMLWQRMAYFGDTLAHGGLLGIAVATIWHLPYWGAMLAVSLAIAVGLRLLEQQRFVSTDALLGLISHVVLALGIVLMTLLPAVQLNWVGMLFGDVLSVTTLDLGVIAILALVVGVLLCLRWRVLLSVILSPALAVVEGVSLGFYRSFYLLLLSVVVALSIKLIGVLLITALLIIPAAAARFWSRNPGQMAFLASLIGVMAVWLGLVISLVYDWPAGPAIVLSAAAIFCVSCLTNFLRR